MFNAKTITCSSAVALLAACGGSNPSNQVVLDNTLTLNAPVDASSGFAFAAASVDGSSDTGSGVYDRGGPLRSPGAISRAAMTKRKGL